MKPEDCLYNYRILEHTLYDGDSLKNCVIDEGRNRFEKDVDIRFKFIDTPEIRRSTSKGIGDYHIKAGKYVRDYIQDLLNNASIVWVKSYKQVGGKYSDILGTVFADDLNINQHLLDKGFAKEYNGGKKQKWLNVELRYIINQFES